MTEVIVSVCGFKIVKDEMWYMPDSFLRVTRANSYLT